MLTRVIVFLVLNFSALGIGGYFTGKGVPSFWYQNLQKAPWTPPGWVFGAAWTSIMVLFAFYMAFISGKVENLRLLIAFYTLQYVLNVMWNPVFFYYHDVLVGLIVISSLLVVLVIMLFYYWDSIGVKGTLLVPYILWLIVATSLNAYILIKN